MTYPIRSLLPPRGRLALASAWLALTPGLGGAPAAHAQPPAAAPEAVTGDQSGAILQELREIRKLLESIDKKGVAQAPQRPVVPPTAKVLLKDAVALGSPDAPVTVVEFTDYQCPYCLRFVQETFPKLKEQYIDTGKVRWVIRDMPLGFHPHAREAAQAAHCAGEQGKFWEMRGVLFVNAKRLEETNLPAYAQTLSLEMKAFTECLASDRHLAAIDRDIQDAAGAQITGTPTFVIGRPAGDSVEGARVVGAREYGAFEAAIKKALGEHTGG
jgi:protein-disulfide isomerase